MKSSPSRHAAQQRTGQKDNYKYTVAKIKTTHYFTAYSTKSVHGDDQKQTKKVHKFSNFLTKELSIEHTTLCFKISAVIIYGVLIMNEWNVVMNTPFSS